MGKTATFDKNFQTKPNEDFITTITINLVSLNPNCSIM